MRAERHDGCKREEEAGDAGRRRHGGVVSVEGLIY
jgi:hypothetical protein